MILSVFKKGECILPLHRSHFFNHHMTRKYFLVMPSLEKTLLWFQKDCLLNTVIVILSPAIVHDMVLFYHL